MITTLKLTNEKNHHFIIITIESLKRHHYWLKIRVDNKYILAATKVYTSNTPLSPLLHWHTTLMGFYLHDIVEFGHNRDKNFEFMIYFLTYLYLK